MLRTVIIGCMALNVVACATSQTQTQSISKTKANTASVSSTKVQSYKNLTSALPDQVHFHQQDARWAKATLGGSGEALETDGCLVTAAAMAMANLGFSTNPGDLTTRLKSAKGFTRQGWLVWSGIERVSGGVAKTKFFKKGTEADVRTCLADGYYPLVKFKLPSRRSHWAMVVGENKKGFYVRDPMVSSTVPIPLSSRAQGIENVRCIGVPSSRA